MKRTALATITLIFASLLAMASEPKLLHVDLNVQEDGEPVSIQLNFPISLIQTMAPNLNEALSNLEEEGEEHNVDIRNIWREVRAAGPNEYVNIQKEGHHITVSTNETTVTIDIDSQEEGKILVKMPLALGDLILGGEGNITVEQVLASLENWQGDLITITGDKVNGHVWID